MTRDVVISYLNSTLRTMYGQITINDAVMMSNHLNEFRGIDIFPQNIIQAAVRSPVEMLEKYKSGLMHALINKYNVTVMSGGQMRVGSIVGNKILRYV